MILPTYIDEEILKELMDDWPSVKRKAKKVGQLMITKLPKRCIGKNVDNAYWYRHKHISKNNNYWSISICCLDGSTKWWSIIHCEAENGYGTKSYFFLRGMNTPHQYYVELIPHAIRRIRERYINTDQEAYFADKDIRDVVDQAVFRDHACGIFYKAGKYNKDKFEAYKDSDGNTPGIVLLKNSMFYARMTPRGNFIFKTFINPEAEEGTRKHDFITMLFGIFISHNVPRGNKSYKEYTDERVKYLLALYEMAPSMKRNIDHIFDRTIPLYP